MTPPGQSSIRFWRREVERLERSLAINRSKLRNVEAEVDGIRRKRDQRVLRSEERLAEARARLKELER